METIISFFKYGLLNGFLIGFLFVVNRKGCIVPNRFYGFWVIALCFVILENVMIMSKDILHFPYLFSLGSLMLMMVPPLYYLLIKSLISSDQKISTLLIAGHSIPFLAMLVFLLPLLTLDNQIKVKIIEDIYYKGKALESKYFFYSAINIVQFLIYNWLIFKETRLRLAVGKKKVFLRRMSWSNMLLFTMNIIVLSYITIYISFIVSSQYPTQLMLLFTGLLLTIIFIVGFQLIRNPFFFTSEEGIYERSTLSSQVSSELDLKFDSFIEDNKIFLDPQLKLAELSAKLEVTQHQLSQFLNQKKKITFPQLLNKYRVEHAKRELIKDANQTILAVALESGFNSQANFIRIFKKSTGYTPSEFRTKMTA